MASAAPPQLNGEFFRITVIEEGYFVVVDENADGTLAFSGYVIDMLQALAKPERANFTYEILTPSGLGSMCNDSVNDTSQELYAATYRTQYDCGTNDVNDLGVNSSFATDFYMGMYYITPERQLRNQFTIPFVPPYEGAPAMYGTATGIPNIQALVEKQMEGTQPPVCIQGSMTVADFINSSFPGIEINQVLGDDLDMYDMFVNGTCEISIFDAPIVTQSVLRLYENGKCHANGKPIGVIGDPMEFGLTHYGIGVRHGIPTEVVTTLSYWMNILMVCNPLDPNGPCPEGNLVDMFQGQGGTGSECGYVLFPEASKRALSKAQVIGLVVGLVGALVVMVIIFVIWHRRKLKQQEHRFKERFVQQIARNIDIGPSPGDIPPAKLSEQILHIGGGKQTISKTDLSNWMHDIKMNFISKADFDALWDAIDLNGSGEVDPVEFVVFLSACGREFEQVYTEQKLLPKSERLKLAARRLTNLSEVGETGVRKLENKLDRNSRGFGPGDKDDSGSSMR